MLSFNIVLQTSQSTLLEKYFSSPCNISISINSHLSTYGDNHTQVTKLIRLNLHAEDI